MSAEYLSPAPKDYDKLVIPPVQVVPERGVVRILIKVIVRTAGKEIPIEGQIEGVYQNPGRRTFKVVTRENGEIVCRSYNQESAVYYPFTGVEKIKRPLFCFAINRIVA